MKGVDCAIDAVGYQARDDENPSKEKATQVLENCVKVVNPTGSLGMIGVYIAPDPGAKSEREAGNLSFLEWQTFSIRALPWAAGKLR